jgi:tripartite-type tricarboxylate transporter receptor subunit TctC
MRNRHKTLVRSAVAVALLTLSAAHAAEPYPARPIRLIVPFSAGGAADIIARQLGAGMTKVISTQIVVDTRPGGGTVVGTELAARASPDGYTLVLVATAFATNPGLLGKLPFDPMHDFAPITLAVDTPLIIVVPAASAASNLRELIALAKSQPQRVIYGSSGQGTSGHLAIELLSFKTGIRMTHVPYKGAGQALIDLIGAQIQLVCTSTLPALPHVRSGQLRGLAVTSAARSRAAPDVPTVAEAAALPGFRASSWYALLAPARTPPAIIGKLHGAAVQALRSPVMADQLLAQGAEAIAGTPDELRRFLQNEIDTWTTVIKAANLRPNT